MADKKPKAEPKTNSISVTADTAQKAKVIRAIKGAAHLDSMIEKLIDAQYASLTLPGTPAAPKA